MPISALLYVSRKPNISSEDFRKHYEAHLELLKKLAGDGLPLSHKRSYIARTTVTSPPDDATTRNSRTPGTICHGQQTELDFDVYAELTFADQAAFEALHARVTATDAVAQI
ncbi:hypothetical protein PENANT_c021G09269 [Penicillium antarcticum]|uniref:EthD domain-containing protein n=1 Tax=Penicillium antarcticum TaxID=416450 RepID=A0A1V6PZW7_9EURO|nr:uncharacterized protein N7508_010941 [Penicillium antarcticum]KAJ5296120.1 hypothetical protein N7508_010941 [Penicillium antarcticum]OQD82505.1 hypothetical protein PENANT_c021G09269 [Penicillium antarcticum]